MLDANKLSAELDKYSEIVIITHEKADGDALGSSIALALGLTGINKKVSMYYAESISDMYSFLPGVDIINNVPPGTLPDNTLIITVDCTDLNRSAYNTLPGSTIVNIDHHISNSFFGDVNFVEPLAAASGEVIFKILKFLKIDITPDIATNLYVAISSDTGVFTYSNTTADTLRICADLVARGADLSSIRENLYNKKSLSELFFIRESLNNMYISADGSIIACSINYKQMLNGNYFYTETDFLTNMMRSLEGVEVALLLKEIFSGEIKVSLRSNKYVDVNLLANEFGGGGHPRAAGCTIRGELEKTRDILIDRALSFYNQMRSK